VGALQQLIRCCIIMPMTRSNHAIFVASVLFFTTHGIMVAQALKEEPLCIENSPERRGEIGCSMVENKILPPNVTEPVFWHIDRFESDKDAMAGAGPSSVAFNAHGSWWLMSVGRETEDHHGGEHIAQVKLSPLPQASSYSMLVISAYIPAGMTSRVHSHSGVEAFYTVEGEQCLETRDNAYRMKKGDTLVVPTGVTMRLVATGPNPRRAFAVIVYDSSKAPVTRMPMEKSSELSSCTR
jgi:quercetin dioxygenase-like cupin family protein